MAIVFQEKTKVFHLYNEKISYVMTVLPEGSIGNLYYGRRLNDNEYLLNLYQSRRRDMSACSFDDDIFTLDDMKQEYPQYGHGDLRNPAYKIEQDNGSTICEFVYDHHEIIQGKPPLENLPGCYVEKIAEAETLIITLKDSLIEMEMKLFYTIYRDYPIITRHCEFYTAGKEVVLERALSMCLDLPDSNYQMITFTGAWARERAVTRRDLQIGVQSIYSLRGNGSSAQMNPFFMLARKNTTEQAGEAIGFSFVYSGNFLGQAEVDNYHVTRVLMGIHPECFSWHLAQNDHFVTPEVILTYSDEGFNGLSIPLHKLLRTRLARGYWRDRERPVLINNWEATYFDFDEEKIINLAAKAKSIGIELFVLDDGWFGERNSDKSSLGDWYVNTSKLPGGITGLAEKIEGLGMKFGIWIEPESINADSDLYRSHSQWVLQVPGRRMSPSRNQFILDFSNDEVVDYLAERIDSLLATAKISYVKWDMNRSLSEAFSLAASADKQQMVMHKYILNLYRLYEYLTSRHPEVLFESCSSGGARFDCGMLYYAPQTWASDDTDAWQRCQIQYGTSYGYPISMIGSHVSASPNHQLGRNTPLTTRANVAYFGTFGYEMDITECTEEELDEMKKQIEFMKENRRLIQQGDFYRLVSPFETNNNAWMVVNENKSKAIAGFYQCLNTINQGYYYLKLQGLDPDQLYQVDDKRYYGDVLMNVGICVDERKINGDFYSKIYLIEAV